jgi:hypothetical protein
MIEALLLQATLLKLLVEERKRVALLHKSRRSLFGSPAKPLVPSCDKSCPWMIRLDGLFLEALSRCKLSYVTKAAAFSLRWATAIASVKASI